MVSSIKPNSPTIKYIYGSFEPPQEFRTNPSNFFQSIRKKPWLLSKHSMRFVNNRQETFGMGSSFPPATVILLRRRDAKCRRIWTCLKDFPSSCVWTFRGILSGLLHSSQWARASPISNPVREPVALPDCVRLLCIVALFPEVDPTNIRYGQCIVPVESKRLAKYLDW